jgi:flagellar protein FlaG
MRIDTPTITGSPLQHAPRAVDKVKEERKIKEEVAPEPQVDKSQPQSEELIQQIKGLTEEGLYSVRFENDERSSQLVVKIVDRQTDEVIRQVPVEEVLELHSLMEGLRGNIVDTQS